MSADPGDVTQILLEFREGNRASQDRLIGLVYADLRRIAAGRLRHEAAGHSLQPTALVHEAYLRLADMKRMDWKCRAHFFAIASTLMRQILVDHARAKRAEKRGGHEPTVYLDENLFPAPGRAQEVIALDDALDQLARMDERQAKVVEMRFFAGMTEEEIGDVLEISTRTVKRDWRIARAWLFKELSH